MADITRERQGQMLQAVFRVLRDHTDGLSANEVLMRMQVLLPPTPFEESTYPTAPNVRRYEKIVRFTTVNAVKAGWLVKDKGTWLLTGEGRSALDKFTDPADLMRESVRLYNLWKKAQPEDEQGEAEDEPTAGATVTLEEAEETARNEIERYLATMPPYEFQNLVAALLRAMDYHVAWIAPPGPDRGIDVVAYTDPLGATGPRIKVQVKRRADKIPVQEVRSFMAVLSQKDVGIFVSVAGFTSEAQNEARHQENRRLTLLGSGDLLDLWVEHYSQVPEADRQLLPLKAVHYLAPAP